MRSPGSLVGIEASTTALKVLLSGFELFPSVVKKILVTHGILEAGPGGGLAIPEDRWFPLESWLTVFDTIRNQIGPNALVQLGAHILENPKFPASIKDIDAALQSIDVAYHSSHRRAGVIMYDAKTGLMLEGIGHYRHRRPPNDRRRIDVVCDTPYPCEVDLGIVTAVASKFEPRARVLHGDSSCRLRGGTSCTYQVAW